MKLTRRMLLLSSLTPLLAKPQSLSLAPSFMWLAGEFPWSDIQDPWLFYYDIYLSGLPSQRAFVTVTFEDGKLVEGSSVFAVQREGEAFTGLCRIWAKKYLEYGRIAAIQIEWHDKVKEMEKEWPMAGERY